MSRLLSLPSPTKPKYRLAQQPLLVDLDADEVQVTLDFVEALRLDKEKHGVTDRMFDQGNTSEGINVIGHLGEQAVAKVLGLKADTTVLTGGDVGHDLFLGETSIQVKTSTLPQLLFNAKHLFVSDVAILAQFIGESKRSAEEDPRFMIWGWIERKEFMKRYHQENYGYGVRLAVDAQTLSPLDTLIEYIEELRASVNEVASS